jgi:hypothetical protein
MSKKTGKITRVSERTWTALRNRGRGKDYEVVDGVPQPEIKDAKPKRKATIEIENLTQGQQEKPKKKKPEVKEDVEPQTNLETDE